MSDRHRHTHLGRAWLEDVLLLLAGVAAVLAGAYVASGVAAALAQDGLTQALRQGLGVEAPLPIRIFRGVQALAAPACLVSAAAVVVHALWRRIARRDLAFGDTLAWDALFSPLISATIAFLACSVWAVARQQGQPFGVAGAAAGLVFALLATSGLAVGSFRRSSVLRWAAAAALAVVALAVTGANLWGRARLAAHDERCDREAAAERERRATAERPLLRGAPFDEDAAPRYRKLFESLGRPGAETLRAVAGADPYAPIPAAARTVLDQHRADLAALREATRCRRCVLGVDFDPASVSGRPVTLAIGQLASALVAEGHEHAQDGDAAGAAERYLDAVRFAGDVAPGSLLNGLVAAHVEEMALAALGRLVLSGGVPPALLEQLERERALLEAGRMPLADSFRCDRLFWCHLDRTLGSAPAQAGLDEPVILPWIVPYRALAARALAVADPLHRRFEQALAAGDRKAWTRIEAEAREQAGSSSNFMLRNMLGLSDGPLSDGSYHARLLVSSVRPLAWFRLAQAAVMLEREGGGAGIPAAIALPADPFADGAPLHAALEGNGYRLWSIGENGKDNGGNAEHGADIVLTARSRGSRTTRAQAAVSK